MPDGLSTTRGTQARHAQFGVETGSDLVEAVQFGKAVAGQDAINGQAMVLGGQQFQATQSTLEDALATDSIVGCRGATIQADLEVERIILFQATRPFSRNQSAVGADTHHKAALSAAFEDLPDAGINKWFATTKMDLEDLHLREFIDKGQRLLRGQFARATASRRGETMDAGDIAGRRYLPGDGDRC